MTHLYTKLAAGWRLLFLLAGLLLAAGAARAQMQTATPTWGGAAFGTAGQAPNHSEINAVAADASGNLFVIGLFTGTIAFGKTMLTSAGGNDLFVAKYVPDTDTWAWALRGGGQDFDIGYGLAVSGNSVYITGILTNSSSNVSLATFGGTGATAGTVVVKGASTLNSQDIIVAKYTDLGNSAALSWTQVAGGTSNDMGYAIAASGSNVYMTGVARNNNSNVEAVVFGGDGTTAGTVPQYGVSSIDNSDIVVAKYLDRGSSASLAWTQVGGGDSEDLSGGIAVSGSSVYVIGSSINDRADVHQVVFGGAGAIPGTVHQAGSSSVSSFDMVVAKYVDLGSSATVGWTQVAGGAKIDNGYAVAASGSNVYVTGFMTNNTTNTEAVVFGGTGSVVGTVPQAGASSSNTPDLVVAKYTDLGSSASLGWTQVAGGAGFDTGQGIAVKGSSVYVAGFSANDIADTNAVVFGGTGSTPGTVPQAGATNVLNTDLLVAKYTDNGATATFAWSQVGGGAADDYSFGLTLSGQRVCVAGRVIPPVTFGLTQLAGDGNTFLGVVAYLTDPTLTPLPTRPATPAGAGLTLHPNPAAGAALLSGSQPGTPVQVLDALGRVVATATADASGTARLPAGLAPGVYVVRAGGAAARLAVE